MALPAQAEQEREASRIAKAYGGALLLHDEAAASFAAAIAQRSLDSDRQSVIQRLSFSELCSAPVNPGCEVSPPDPEAPAYLLETSGTTGTPRAACFNGQSEPAELLDRAVLWLFPLSSSSGISGAFAQHRLTAFLPLREAIRNPDRMLALIEHHRITGFSMPPVLLSALLRHLREPNGPLQPRDLSSLTRVNIGSAASSAADLAALQEQLEPWGLASGVIHTGYGLTETGVLAWGPFEAERALAVAPGETLVGPLYKTVETQLVDGVLQARKPFSFLGYLEQPCLQSGGNLALEPFRSGEDWFNTGDRARLTESSPPQLVLCGRTKDILVVNSRKLSLPAMEQSLQQQFAQLLELACGCAMPPTAGSANERLLLVLAPTAALSRQGVLAGDLRQQLEEQIQSHLLGHFGVGAASIHLLEASAFPRTSTGKIRKAELLALITASEAPATAESPTPARSQPLAQTSEIEQYLLSWIQTHAPLHQPLHRGQKLSAFGIDSLAFAGLIGELERRHGQPCQLERCPNDPSIGDLLALFHAPTAAPASTGHPQTQWRPDPRKPAQVLVRHSLEQLLRAANLQSTGRRVGLGGIARLHNSEATGQPVALVSAWPESVIQNIAKGLPENPIYAIRVAHDYATPANHQYMLFCYLEWIESVLAPLQTPFILAGNCRAALLTLELAQLLQPRQLQPRLTVLLEWDPRLATQVTPFSGAVAYQIHRDHHSGDPQKSSKILEQLRIPTPSIYQVTFSSTNSNKLGYPTQRHPYNALIQMVEKLNVLVNNRSD